MRIGNLLTSALALTNLLNPNKPGAPQEANTNALQPSPVEAGLQPTGVGGNIPRAPGFFL